MNNKSAILIISSWYPSEENPTEGSFVHEQVKMLQKKGHGVTVVKPNLSGTFIETIKGKKAKNRNYDFEEVPVFEVGVNVCFPKLKAYYYAQLSKKVATVLKKNNIQFDVIHSHALLSAGMIAPYISQLFRKRLFHTEHTSGLIFNPSQFDSIDQQGIIKLVEHSEKVFFVSRFAKENSLIYKDSHNDKIVVLHNIVENSFFEYSFLEKKNQIITIANFSFLKNQQFLLKVWNEFNKNGKNTNNCKLVFAGNGFDAIEFTSVAKNVANIEVIPHLNRQEVKEKIVESKALLSGSKLETFGLTIAEALALGTPVVVTNSGGPRDIVEKGDGFIVEQGNVDLFVSKIQEILNENHDSNETIRKRCHSKFSEEVIYGQLIQCYGKFQINSTIQFSG